MLRDLADEGAVERRRKKLHACRRPPARSCCADITERDRDGELIAVPTEWDTEEHGEAPRIRIHVPRKARSAEIARRRRPRAAAHGSSRPRTDRSGYTGRVIKILDRPRQRAARRLPRTAERRRAARAGRQEAARPRAHDSARRDRASAKDGDLVAVELDAPRPAAACRPRSVKRAARLAEERARRRASSPSTPTASPTSSPTRCSRKPRRRPRRWLSKKDREDWRDLPLVTIDPPDAKDHDDAVPRHGRRRP